jgi:hypothetical protein
LSLLSSFWFSELIARCCVAPGGTTVSRVVVA